MSARLAPVSMLQTVTKDINRCNVTNSYMNQKDLKREVREKVIQERGEICETCKTVPSYGKSSLIIHHVVPKKHGGTNEPTNLMVLCYRCHNKLHGNGTIIRLRPDLVDWLGHIAPSPTKALEILQLTYHSNKETVELLREIKEHILSR